MKIAFVFQLILPVSIVLSLGHAGYFKANNQATTELVSIASDGTPGNDYSHTPSISANGRSVAFTSAASNLVKGDTNKAFDVFVHDRKTGKTKRVSVSSDGSQGNNFSYASAISADGRHVAFSSLASNLVSEDKNNNYDVFVHDLENDETELVSVSNRGSQGNSWSIGTSISADGRFVAFTSYSSNLVHPDTNGFGSDVFLHDRQTGTTELISLDAQGLQFEPGAESPYISPDGRYVLFTAYIESQIPGGGIQVVPYIRDRISSISEQINVNCPAEWDCALPHADSLSADGRYVVLTAGIGALNVFVFDRIRRETDLISTAIGGTTGNSASRRSSISIDGRYVVFYSSVSNLVFNDMNGTWDIFIRDRLTQTTQLASVANDGSQGNLGSYWPSISPDGRFIVFSSDAYNLVPFDTNFLEDVYVRDLGSPSADYRLYLPLIAR